ncbi:MAG: DUF5668 domain-containing protein [Anaerolineae bacterium]|nr:DUF5668 domain-containing protein [Thermoflexales bacterium]MDW8408405.1 DUF5668 domain-containing protein [Anaerolineae bacterium]
MKTNAWFWGALLILLGALLLFDNLNILPFPLWDIIWPSLLIAAGAWLLLGARRAPRAVNTQRLDIPLTGESAARIKLSHGVGELMVSSGAAPGYVLSGTFNGSVQYRSTCEAGRQLVKIKSPLNLLALEGLFSREARLCSVMLSSQIPLSLDIESNASMARIDLADVRLTDLELEMGASSAEVSLPLGVGYTRVKIEAGAASISLRLPPEAEARVRFEGGLSSLNIDQTRFVQTGNRYQTAGFDAASDRLDIDIEAGVGSVSIR